MSKDARDKMAELLYEKYRNLIWVVAYEFVKDESTLEEIRQDVVYNCSKKRELLEQLEETERRAYVCMAAKNTARNARMKLKRQEEIVEKYEENYNYLQPERHVDFKAFNERFGISDETSDLLDSLKPIDKDILLLKYYVGLNNEEVGAVLGLSMEAVKKRFQRVKIRLMSRLIESEEGEINDEK